MKNLKDDITDVVRKAIFDSIFYKFIWADRELISTTIWSPHWRELSSGISAGLPLLMTNPSFNHDESN